MARIAYVNGRYLPMAHARIGIEDRGFQFADGVYEVVAIASGRLVDEDPHLDRLDRSLAALRIVQPMARRPLQLVLREIVRRNGVTDGIVYIQVTRGEASRDHKFPHDVGPTLVVYAWRKSLAAVRALAERGVRTVTTPDIRWKRCDIKSVSLLANCLAKQQAAEAHAYEAIFVDADGMVTEGSSTNIWIVTADGVLVTHPTGSEILEGITRTACMALAAASGMRVEERAFSLTEAMAAREVFLTSATSFVMPIVDIDGTTIADGVPGSLCRRLLDRYASRVAADPLVASPLPPVAAVVAE